MAAFATHTACETRAYAKVLDKTWCNAYFATKPDGTKCVRVQRLMSPTSPGGGEWVEITDDATV